MERKSIDQRLAWKNVPSTNLTDATAVVFPPRFSIMATIVPQLDKRLKFKSIRGGGGDKNDCTPFNISSRNTISFRDVSTCSTMENHLTLFNKRHLSDEDRVDGIFNPQPRRRDVVLILCTRF